VENVLLTAGVICLIAAIIGGGIKIFGSEIPLLKSNVQRVSLTALGVILLGAFGWMEFAPDIAVADEQETVDVSDDAPPDLAGLATPTPTGTGPEPNSTTTQSPAPEPSQTPRCRMVARTSERCTTEYVDARKCEDVQSRRDVSATWEQTGNLIDRASTERLCVQQTQAQVPMRLQGQCSGRLSDPKVRCRCPETRTPTYGSCMIRVTAVCTETERKCTTERTPKRSCTPVTIEEEVCD
jgi:hypothetical protein